MRSLFQSEFTLLSTTTSPWRVLGIADKVQDQRRFSGLGHCTGGRWVCCPLPRGAPDNYCCTGRAKGGTTGGQGSSWWITAGRGRAARAVAPPPGAGVEAARARRHGGCPSGWGGARLCRASDGNSPVTSRPVPPSATVHAGSATPALLHGGDDLAVRTPPRAAPAGNAEVSGGDGAQLHC